MNAQSQPIRVTVWGENIHEKTHKAVSDIYPNGMHATIAAGIEKELGSAVSVRTATLDQPEHGLTDDVLAQTDVLTWWGHAGHKLVQDAIVEKVHARVLNGMGLLVLHSGHVSKIFRKLMGTSGSLKWREDGGQERLWIVNPSHPIVDGLKEYIELPHTEMYGEHFDIPAPDELIFISWFEGGEVFRSGCTWTRGKGKIFYFRPGHETYPIYHDPNIQKVLANGVRWAKPAVGSNYSMTCPHPPALNPVKGNQKKVDASIHEKK